MAVSYTHLDVYKRQRSFSVDLENHGETFAGNGAHKGWDLPYVRDFVAYVGCNHSEIVLDNGALNDDEVNRIVLRAFDAPTSLSGDMCSSLYQLFRAIRRESTVALSGESADEIFGGYAWFHDRNILESRKFPWLLNTGSVFNGANVLDRDVRETLALQEFEEQSYACLLYTSRCV